MPPRLHSARKNYALSALIARKATREAQKARRRGPAAVAGVVLAHQVAQAQTSDRAVAEMLAEQEIDSLAEAMLNALAFTTEPRVLEEMVEQVKTDQEFNRLVASIVQDAARAAESVAIAVRPDIYHVRFVNLPCCSRCAILAGRVYRWSDGFKRHPGCDCSMIPTTVASPLVQDVDELVRTGQVTGLSKADMEALRDGANLGQVVNIRKKSAGLMNAGQALARGGRPTPAGIYQLADGDRDKALRLLRVNGYIT
jgi:hypothetical protein